MVLGKFKSSERVLSFVSPILKLDVVFYATLAAAIAGPRADLLCELKIFFNSLLMISHL